MPGHVDRRQRSKSFRATTQQERIQTSKMCKLFRGGSLATRRGKIGKFGWDGVAGSSMMIDPVNHISAFYAMHVRNFGYCYDVIHPKVRDLIYEGFGM